MPGRKLAIEQDGLQQIIGALAGRGYRVIGPTVRDGAIVYDTVAHRDELPVGWTDQQDGGRYRLERFLRALIRMLLAIPAPAQTPNECSSSVLHGRLIRTAQKNGKRALPAGNTARIRQYARDTYR